MFLRLTRLMLVTAMLALPFAQSAEPAVVSNSSERAAAPDNAVIRWNKALILAVVRLKTSPPVASRAMAMTHTAMFDAWAAYDLKAVGTRLDGTLRRPEAEHTDVNKEIAMGFAAYRILKDLFPTQQSIFEGALKEQGQNPADTSTDVSTPAGIGNTVAAAILAYRHTDGSNQLGDLNPGAYTDYTSYKPVNDSATLTAPDKWQPLRLKDGSVQTFLVPHWGLIKPFALPGIDEPARKKFMPKPCATAPSKSFTKQAKDVVEISANLDDRQKSIALYWADGAGTPTPPGHWCEIAQFISQRDGHSLDDDVKLFFALGNAVFDAGIACWECKRLYDSVRPISAIRHLFKDQNIESWGGPGLGTQSIPGQTWQPYIQTPPFGEYVSGHSTFSAASAQILVAFKKNPFFGLTVAIPAGFSTVEPNVPAAPIVLRWEKFSDAANEAGLSRRYGGIHFKDGDLQGRRLGKLIGVTVWKKAQSYINGR